MTNSTEALLSSPSHLWCRVQPRGRRQVETQQLKAHEGAEEAARSLDRSFHEKAPPQLMDLSRPRCSLWREVVLVGKRDLTLQD